MLQKRRIVKKIVLIASSFLHTTEIINEKPNIVRHYNATKGGTDNFDKLCHSYTVSGKTNRWPARIFCGILDQAIVNARILLKCKYKNRGINKKVTAIECLEDLYIYLITPYLQERYTTCTLRRDIKVGIAAILKIDDVSSKKTLQRIQLDYQQRCVLRKRKDDKKSRKGCASCTRAVCDKHSFIICVECCGEF